MKVLVRDLERHRTTTIGERIRKARKETGLNQADLAARIGVSQPTVANWESGIHDPRRLMLAKLSEALGVPLTWLSEGARSLSEQDKHPAAAYLRRYLQHVPIISAGNAAGFAKSPEPDPHDYAEDYIPVTYGEARLFALFVTDDSVNLAFPPDTLVVIDYEDTEPKDGNFCLVAIGGVPCVRRWRDEPARFEPYSTVTDYETHYCPGDIPAPGTIIGCVRVSIRFH